MKVVTRFAPTISGELHIGGLYNALLNYLYAKRHDGLFKLRLDGMDTLGPHADYLRNIPEDLMTFGLHPDEILRACDRIDVYKEEAYGLIDHPRSYDCDCTVQDLLHRARKSPTDFYHLYRPEKYPPYCQICQIQVFGVENDLNLAAGCEVVANREAEGHPVSQLTARAAKGNLWWEPYDVGCLEQEDPKIDIDLGTEQVVRAVQIVWKDRPALEYAVHVDNTIAAAVCKSDSHFVEYKAGHPFLPLQSDVINFAPRKTRHVGIEIFKCAHPVDVPYFYDFHCRDRNKKLDPDHRDTVLRLRAEKHFSEYDVAYWYGKMPNLVLTSVLDDYELDVTHCIRGRDIAPWIALEGQVALALDTPARDQRIHGMIKDKQGYKYSKWRKSTPVRDYLKQGITADAILIYLAEKAGLIEEKVSTLQELVDAYDGVIPTQDIVIDEQEMLDELRG